MGSLEVSHTIGAVTMRAGFGAIYAIHELFATISITITFGP